MAEARTTLEAVFAATAGDISQLIDKVEAVEGKLEGLLLSLPAAGEQVNATLKPTLDQIYAGVGRLQEGAEILLKQQQAAATAVVAAQAQALRAGATEAADVEIARLAKAAAELRAVNLDSLGRQIRLAVTDAFESDVVRVHVGQAVGKVKNVADGLDAGIAQFAQATLALDAATRQLTDATIALGIAKDDFVAAKGKYTRKLVLLAGGFVAALAIVLYALVRFGGVSISDKQLTQLRADQQEAVAQAVAATQRKK